MTCAMAYTNLRYQREEGGRGDIALRALAEANFQVIGCWKGVVDGYMVILS